MEVKKREGNKSIYHYPVWVTSVERIEQLNVSNTVHLFASELTVSVHGNAAKYFDLRLWRDGEPTKVGVYFSLSGARLLRELLNQFIKEREESD